MKEISSTDLKAHLPHLLDAVERGETVIITRDGLPIARLVPIRAPTRSIQETIAAIRAFGEHHKLEGMTTKELIEEGRRY